MATEVIEVATESEGDMRFWYLGKSLLRLAVLAYFCVVLWFSDPLYVSLCNGLASHPVGNRNTPTCFMLQKWGKHLPDVLFGLYADFAFVYDL